MGNAQHRIMRGMDMRIGEIGGVGGNQRQIAGIGEVDQRRFRRVLSRYIGPGELDI
jgi:hypothetical protein